MINSKGNSGTLTSLKSGGEFDGIAHIFNDTFSVSAIDENEYTECFREAQNDTFVVDGMAQKLIYRTDNRLEGLESSASIVQICQSQA